jgi:hypothetical protein
MRSFHDLLLDRIADGHALVAAATCDEWLVAGEKWEPESAART